MSKNSLYRSTLLVLFFLSIGFVSMYGQSVNKRAERAMHRIDKIVNLTASQEAAFMAAYMDVHDFSDSGKTKADVAKMTKAQKEQGRKNVGEAMMAKIEAILTPAQLALFQNAVNKKKSN